jgi:hypothetical protein
VSALFECTRAQASGAHCLGISDEAAHTGLAGAFIFGETSGAVTDVTVLYNTCAAPPVAPPQRRGFRSRDGTAGGSGGMAAAAEGMRGTHAHGTVSTLDRPCIVIARPRPRGGRGGRAAKARLRRYGVAHALVVSASVYRTVRHSASLLLNLLSNAFVVAAGRHSRARTHNRSHTHTHSRTGTHTQTHTHSRTHTDTRTHTHTLTHTETHAHARKHAAAHRRPARPDPHVR